MKFNDMQDNLSLTHFRPMFHLYTPWKRHKTNDFLTFLGRRNGTLGKMGQSLLPLRSLVLFDSSFKSRCKLFFTKGFRKDLLTL